MGKKKVTVVNDNAKILYQEYVKKYGRNSVTMHQLERAIGYEKAKDIADKCNKVTRAYFRNTNTALLEEAAMVFQLFLEGNDRKTIERITGLSSNKVAARIIFSIENTRVNKQNSK